MSDLLLTGAGVAPGAGGVGINTHSIDLESSSSQYLSITNAAQTGLNLAGDLTIEAWIRPESTGASQIICGKYDTGADERQYLVTRDSAGNIRLSLSDDGTFNVGNGIQFLSAASIGTGTFVHIAITFDISTEAAKLYIDGVDSTFNLNSGTTIGASLYSGTAPFAVGASFSSGTPSGYADMLIDELRVWNVVRSQADIQNNRSTQLVGNEAGLVAYYRFNNDPNDTTANGNDLTPTNAPVYSTTVAF